MLMNEWIEIDSEASLMPISEVDVSDALSRNSLKDYIADRDKQPKKLPKHLNMTARKNNLKLR